MPLAGAVLSCTGPPGSGACSWLLSSGATAAAPAATRTSRVAARRGGRRGEINARILQLDAGGTSAGLLVLQLCVKVCNPTPVGWTATLTCIRPVLLWQGADEAPEEEDAIYAPYK